MKNGIAFGRASRPATPNLETPNLRPSLLAAALLAMAAPALAETAASAPAKSAAIAPGNSFCLSHPLACEGYHMLERDRDAVRDFERREASRPAPFPATTSPDRSSPGPTPDAARRYRDFCLGAPSACSGNFVLDRQSSAYRRLDPR